MYTNALDSRNWAVNAAATSAASASSDASGADFAKFLEELGASGKSSPASKSSGSSAGDLMDYLSRSFPGVNFSEGSVGGTPKDVRDYFGSEEGDNVAITPEAAEAVAGNSALSSMLDNILASFEETAGATQPVEGARVQRNVMVASVTIRFSVSQIDSRSGETLSMNELTSAFSEFADKLGELAQKFFGGAETGSGSGEGSEGGSENIDIVAEGKEPVEGEENPFAEYFGGSMSFSMFFAAGRFGSQGGTGTSGTEDGGDFSLKDFMNSFKNTGNNFQNFMSSTFSMSMFGGMSMGGMSGLSGLGNGSNPFTSLLDGGMDMFGMSRTGMWQQGGGMSLRYGQSQSNNLIAELMNMLNSSRPASGAPEPAVANPAETPVEDTAESAEVPAEEAAAVA